MIVYDVKCANLTRCDKATFRDVVTNACQEILEERAAEVARAEMGQAVLVDRIQARAVYRLAIGSAFAEVATKVGPGHCLVIVDAKVKKDERGDDGFPVIVVSVGVDPKDGKGINTTEVFKEAREASALE